MPTRKNADLSRAPLDYDGDGRTDLTTFLPTGYWEIQANPAGAPFENVEWWGLPGDVPVRGDFNGDGRADFAVFRHEETVGDQRFEGRWFVREAKAGSGAVIHWNTWWGLKADIPVPGDYDGDGVTNLAVFRPSEHAWYVSGASGKGPLHWRTPWGQPGDIPVPADYDGDGVDEIAIFRPATVEWWVRTATGAPRVLTCPGGLPGDVPMWGDYDGDGAADLALFRPDSGRWNVCSSRTGLPIYKDQWWGLPGDFPLSGDYNGDGRSDLAVFRPSTKRWYIFAPGFSWDGYLFGKAVSIPVASTPQAYSTLGVAAVKSALLNSSLTTRIMEIQKRLESAVAEALVAGRPIDLIVTPEYSFYADRTAHSAIRLDPGPKSGSWTISPTGAETSAQVALAVRKVQRSAEKFRTNILLGTVPELYTVNGQPVVFNTALIIDWRGEIVHVKRKTQGSDWCRDSNNRECSGDLAVKAREIALASSDVIALQTAQGRVFSLLPLICAERSDLEIPRRLRNRQADLLAVTEREGDGQYEALMNSIQNGTFDPREKTWVNFVKKYFLNPFVTTYRAVRAGGFVVIDDGAFSQVGIIQLREPPTPLIGGILRDRSGHSVQALLP